MLALTDAATRVIRYIASEPDVPDVAGLRVARTPEGLTVSPGVIPVRQGGGGCAGRSPGAMAWPGRSVRLPRPTPVVLGAG